MTKVIVYESPGADMVEFRRSPGGKKEKFVKYKDWEGDPKKLRKEAEKLEKEG